jgi:hypothetical protein
MTQPRWLWKRGARQSRPAPASLKSWHSACILASGKNRPARSVAAVNVAAVKSTGNVEDLIATNYALYALYLGIDMIQTARTWTDRIRAAIPAKEIP